MTNQSSINAPGHLSPAMRILPMLARLKLSDTLRQTLADLLAQVDGRQVAGSAHRKFLLPLAFRHAKAIGLPESHPFRSPEVRTSLSNAAIYLLNVAREQKIFVERFLEPHGVQYAVFKGISLSSLYYPDPSMRICRDIDILVDPKAMHDLVRRAVKAGYIVYPDEATQGTIETDRDLRAYLRYINVIRLKSPNNIAIELHKALDKGTGLFCTRKLLDQAVTLPVMGQPMRTLRPSHLFTYLCFHHSTHNWSKLIWLADIDAILQSSHFDLDESIAYAEEVGIAPAVRFAVELSKWTGAPDFPGTDLPDDRLQVDFLKGLEGDIETEYEIRHAHGKLPLIFPDYVSDHAMRRARWQKIKRAIGPNHAEYCAYPLPDQAQWLYAFTRLFGQFKRYSRN